MAYEPGALEATLAAAAGGDPALLGELRRAYQESVARQVDLLARARCDGNWELAAQRLLGLAASFHCEDLRAMADAALRAAPGEPTAVRRLQSYIDRFSGS
ncbi:Hpt domain-containing protein [Novosphingobium sp. 1949]|uniref:Hpt domain-containing protein n=1 Tax=Novosphingobium organovorum TaxID=2930092 RepID=A0ABT0B7W5_9SPHN|nr:Hpt domain-containing protein [Novosphingobium organovorum]MCJ2181129.1 Hpt domain-containing protein [Novosphingobium organovorum]